MRTPEVRLGKWELHMVMLEDKTLFEEYIKKTPWPVNLWSGNFPFIWSYAQSSRRNIYWKIIDGMLVTFILTRKKKLLLHCLPFGSGNIHHLVSVLHEAMHYCADHNRNRGFYTKVRTVNESQLAYLNTSEKFSELFALKKLRGMEKHFGIHKLIALSGKEYDSIRRTVNKFYRLNSEIKFREYKRADFEKVWALNKRWEDTAGKKYKAIFDKDYIYAIIKHYEELKLQILVAERRGEIVGVNVAGALPHGEAWGCICKTVHNIEGLNEAIIIRMVQAINTIESKIETINVGSDMGIEGLRRYKEKFKPVLNLERYSLFLRG